VKTNNVTNWILSAIALISFLLNYWIYHQNKPVTNPTIQEVILGINNQVLSEPKFLTDYYLSVKIYNSGNKQVTINDFGFRIEDSTETKFRTNAH